MKTHHQRDRFWSIKSQNQPIPPKQVMIESEKLLKIEVAKLREERQNKLDNLLKQIPTNCSTEVKDSIVLSLIVESDGEIENYNILKASKSEKLKVDCLNEFLGQTEMNLSMLKVVPSARSPIAQKVTYTLPIR